MNPQRKIGKLDKIGLLITLFIIGSIFISNLLILNPIEALYYVDYVFITIVYAFTAILVWIVRNNLLDFHFDRWSLFTIVLTGSIFHRRLGLPGEIGFQILLWICSLSILLFIIIYRSKIPKTNASWTLSGLFIGLSALIPIALVETIIPELSFVDPTNLSNNLILEVMRKLIYELSYVAPLEEILFRGLLWGFLVRVGWKEEKAFWAQAILFWIGHMSRLGYPISFFITIPIGTLVYSILVRYSKQLFPSIVAHSILNTLLPISVYILT